MIAPERVSLPFRSPVGRDCIACPEPIEPEQRVVVVRWSDGDESYVHEECAP